MAKWLGAIVALAGAMSAHAVNAPANPAPTAAEEWRFRVLLDGREVGWHRFRVGGDGDTTEVESRAQFDVPFLFVTAYRYRHEARERWLDGCLDRLDSRTETNGRTETVAASARGDGLLVRGPSGQARLSGCVMSFAYWDPRILGATRLLNSQTGELVPVRVIDRGTEQVTTGGRAIPATRHRLSAPDLEIDLWYADGRWIALEAPTPGGRVLRYELQ